LRSLRSRLLLGSLLWTGGLLPIAHLAAILLIHHFQGLRLGHVDGAMALFMLALAALGLVGGLWHFRKSLTPFQRLRARLSAVRDGSEPRVDGAYPSEVQPVVDDLNALLEQRERMVERALQKAGDLAHGLKTPLAVLAQESELAAAGGQTEIATNVSQQVERMRRQIDYHLAQARAAATAPRSAARCSSPPRACAGRCCACTPRAD
jgi:signal transduction histidine kinase